MMRRTLTARRIKSCETVAVNYILDLSADLLCCLHGSELLTIKRFLVSKGNAHFYWKISIFVSTVKEKMIMYNVSQTLYFFLGPHLMGFSKIRIPRKIKQYQMLVKFGPLDLFYCQATDTLQRFLIKHIPFTENVPRLRQGH